MTTYTFEYKQGRSFKRFTTRAADIEQAREAFEVFRATMQRVHLMRVGQC